MAKAQNKKPSQKPRRKLTDNQKLFIAEYLVDRNATRAYLAAYPNVKKVHTAEQAGSRLLRNVKVATAIDKAIEKKEKQLEISADRVIKESARLAFFDPRKLFDENGNPKSIHELDDDTAACIGGIDIVERSVGDKEDLEFETVKKIKIWDKNSAIDKLGKYFKLFTDRVQHGFDEQALELILAALPPEYAKAVKAKLAEMGKK